MSARCHMCPTASDEVELCEACGHWFCPKCRHRWLARGAEYVRLLLFGSVQGCCGIAMVLALLLSGCSPTVKTREKSIHIDRKRWVIHESFEAKTGGNQSPDGASIQIDFPGDRHKLNQGGSDGAGLCVFDSAHHAGDWQGDPLFYAIFQWMRKHPGGGWPEKFDSMIARASQELGLPIPEYIHVQDNDLEILKLACKNGLMPSSTYSWSPTGRYNGRRIAHMVNVVHASDEWFAVLDNNYIGENAYEWMKPTEFLKSYSGGRTGWSIILLTKSPPPPPKGVQ